MANRSISIPKAHLIMVLCLPLAVLLGYLLAEPLDPGALAVVTFVLTVLAVPMMMKWYHPLLLLSWNAFIYPAFLPGSPGLWMLVAFASLLVAVLNRAVDPAFRFVKAPAVTWSLLAFLAVILITAQATGGIGLQILGAKQFGGKRYFAIFMAIAGYFAITSRGIPLHRVGLALAFFFLPCVLTLVGNIALALGPGFYFLGYLFPVDPRDMVEGSALFPTFTRITGLAPAAFGLYCWLLARYGIRGILDVRKPLRVLLFAIAVFATLTSGFRSALMEFGLMFMFLFFFEGLHRTKVLPMFALIGLVGAIALVPFTDKLPWAAQRSLAFLPLKIDPAARTSAEASSEWRLAMWKTVLPEVPSHLLLGKGYGIDGGELYGSRIAEFAGAESGGNGAIVAGDYHNGPLSVVMPFGLPGMIALLWFFTAALRVLYHNFKFGEPQLQTMNGLLLALFATKVLMFFAVFGALSSDLQHFAGLIGLGVSLNGPQPAPEREEDLMEGALEPVM